MNQSIEERLESCRSSWIAIGEAFRNHQKEQGNISSKQTLEALGYLWEAYLILCGVLGRALAQTQGELTKFKDKDRHREALFAAFSIGLEPLETTIMSGRHLQAHALLRQEIDTLVQLQALRQGKRREGKALNWRLLNDPSMQRL